MTKYPISLLYSDKAQTNVLFKKLSLWPNIILLKKSLQKNNSTDLFFMFKVCIDKKTTHVFSDTYQIYSKRAVFRIHDKVFRDSFLISEYFGVLRI